jgi:hypothetical protein
MTSGGKSKHCPRCGYDLTIIEISTEICTPTQLKRKQAEKELLDLHKMLANWGTAYKRLVDESGVDWSHPHEFLQEVVEHMFPWIARLRESDNFTAQDMGSLSDAFEYECSQLIIKLEQEEYIMRLTGRWTDDEQSIKEYWEKEWPKGIPFAKYVQLSMRNEQREPSD